LNDLIPDFPEVDESLVERVAAALRPASALSVISSFEHLYEVQLEQAGTTDLPEQVLAHWRDLGYDAALGDNGILVLSKRSQQREAEELALLREEEQREFAAARLQQEQAMAPTTTTLCSLRPTAEVFVPAAAVVPVFGQPQPPPLPPAAGGSLFGGSLFGGGGGDSFLGAAVPAAAAISEATPFSDGGPFGGAGAPPSAQALSSSIFLFGGGSSTPEKAAPAQPQELTFIPVPLPPPGFETRPDLINRAFRALDANDDGFLNKEEMKKFAELSGFSGTPAKWANEFRMMCSGVGADIATGLDSGDFRKVINEGLFCSYTNVGLKAMCNILDPEGKASAKPAVEVSLEVMNKDKARSNQR